MWTRRNTLGIESGLLRIASAGVSITDIYGRGFVADRSSPRSFSSPGFSRCSAVRCRGSADERPRRADADPPARCLRGRGFPLLASASAQARLRYVDAGRLVYPATPAMGCGSGELDGCSTSRWAITTPLSCSLRNWMRKADCHHPKNLRNRTPRRHEENGKRKTFGAQLELRCAHRHSLCIQCTGGHRAAEICSLHRLCKNEALRDIKAQSGQNL